MNPKSPNGWIDKINRSTFFILAVLLHVLVLLVVATWIVYTTLPPASSPDFAPAYVKLAPVPPPPPHAEVSGSQAPDLTPPDNLSPITTPNPSASKINVLPAPVDLRKYTSNSTGISPSKVIAPPHPGLSPERIEAIRENMKRWVPPSEMHEIADDVHNLKTNPFPVYLAIYAGGDWSCNNTGSATEITAGCLPNLAAQMRALSNGNLITGEIKPIRIDSPELLSDPPPFIFFTGHRDFKLTAAEILNLQKYLQGGGAIWGDSAFAGAGSRFDVAFHREMKLVLPDKDIQFEPLDLSHDIFTHSYFPIEKVAAGMNYRSDPIEIMNLDGRLAVIYTPNDYSDMMTMLLVPGADPPQADTTWPPTPDHPLFTYGPFLGDRSVFFRNYEPQSASNVYRLSTNIVVHLLTRFAKDLELAP